MAETRTANGTGAEPVRQVKVLVERVNESQEDSVRHNIARHLLDTYR
jgi:hypothetical protein